MISEMRVAVVTGAVLATFIAAAIAYNDRRLARIDAPPLWSAQARGKGDTTTNSLRTGLMAEAEFVRDYGNATVEAALRAEHQLSTDRKTLLKRTQARLARDAEHQRLAPGRLHADE